MRQIVLALTSLAAVFAAGAANAADMPVKAPRTAMVAPAFNWTGFYIGINAGYGWSSVSSPGIAGDIDMDGWLGGGQIGYNWQSGVFVFGLEGDIQGTGIQASGIVPGVLAAELSMPWFATFRLRGGITHGPVLFYITGGGAYSNVNLDLAGVGGLTASSDDSNFGYTIGGGVEWKFAPQWSVKGEYLYLDTGDTSATLFGVTVNARNQTHIARGGVNFHFAP
jgi:outer membrane immunogenic protein